MATWLAKVVATSMLTCKVLSVTEGTMRLMRVSEGTGTSTRSCDRVPLFSPLHAEFTDTVLTGGSITSGTECVEWVESAHSIPNKSPSIIIRIKE